MTTTSRDDRTALTIDGERFAHRTTGRGQPLVLVHGNLSDMRSWEAIEDLLAERFEVVTYSRRYAHPNRPIGRGIDDQLAVHARDLIALIETLDLGPVHLLGNSSGAFICLLVAAERPDLVRSLSLEEPPVVSLFAEGLPPRPADLLRLLVTAPGALVDFLAFGARSIGPAIKAFERGDDDAGLDAFCRGVIGSEPYARLSPERRRQMLDNLAPHRAALLGAGLPLFTPEQARAVRVRTQLIRGERTSRFQTRINRRLAKLIPGARDVVVGGASHLVHEDDPRAVADAVLAFTRAG